MNAITSVSGEPFFTSLEDLTFDAATGKDTKSVLLGLEYVFMDKFSLGINWAEFRATNRSDYHTEEINYFLNYNWNDKLSSELMYAVIDDKN